MKPSLLLVAGLIAGATAATVMSPSYKSVTSLGYYAPSNWDSATGRQPGARTSFYLANDTLRLGDVVYLTSKNKVAKSATLANYNAIIGVVVGGARVSMNALTLSPDTGVQVLVATANQRVIVATSGRVWVKIDTTTGTGIAPGTAVMPSATGTGMAKARTTAIDSFNRIFGRLIDSGIVGRMALINLNVK